LQKYLHGETFEDESVKNGWCIVCINGLPLGLGKAVNGVVKNHLPKGIRAT
jgi:NOL1/NOP2/fmu family ribosome biogenesis protein